MNTSNLSKFTKGLRTTLHKRSPEILMGIGITGMFTTTILAVKATPKALRLMSNELYEQDTDHLTVKDIIQVTWKCYIPAAVTGCLSTICILGANSVNNRRNTALTTAYILSESAFKEYKDKILETIGDKKEQGIRDAIAKDKIERTPLVIKRCSLPTKEILFATMLFPVDISNRI